jgi:DNA-binding IclR family transcriptional regulator
VTKPFAVRGAQAATRALNILKRISSHHPDGIRIGELAAAEQLDRATAYRLAGSLVESGLVIRDDAKVYRLGIEAMTLGLASMRGAPIVEQVRPAMRRLARRTEDTVFLVVRNGEYGHCVHCEEGAYPVKALVLQVGGMRVLGLGSASITLLTRQSELDVEQFHKAHADEFRPHGMTARQLGNLIAQTRKQGFASTRNVVTEGVSAVGVGFELNPGSYAALSIAAINTRMQEQRKPWIARLIVEELATSGLQAFPPAA